jgi:dihydrofolate reductase
MISIIVAMDENNLIGKDNELPWYLPADLQYFKKTTMGHPVIMGRKTFESIGRPLPGRENVILTRDPEYQQENCTILHSMDELKAYTESKPDEYFVIGGAELIKQALSFASKLYITKIHHQFEGDTYFPPFDEKEWTLVSKTPGPVDEKNKYAHDYFIYERKS